jgi:predicted esterase
VLYALATTPPGFAVDEPVERLGERLMLPPQYEPRRAQLEAILPPIHLPAPPSPATLLAAAEAAADAPAGAAGESLGFVHRFVAASGEGERGASTTLLMLHGTGGDEDDLLPLAGALLPGAAVLSPRGRVQEGEAARFFRRLAEGVLDQEDLARRTAELAEFVEGAAARYRLDPGGVVAVGFSNGANIAASLLLRRPGLLRAAVLLSPMLPFEPETLPDLAGTAVFVGAGRADPLVPAAQVERLVELLRAAGAAVALHWEPGGHAVTGPEVEAARAWLAARIAGAAAARPGPDGASGRGAVI